MKPELLIIKKILIVIATLLLISSVNYIFAQGLTTNAIIVNNDVNLRDSPPKFGFKSLFTFQYENGDKTGLIPAGTRIYVKKRTIIDDSWEWFEVDYESNGSTQSGWIMGGSKGNIDVIEFDPGVLNNIPLVYKAAFIGNNVLQGSMIRGSNDPVEVLKNPVYYDEPVIKTHPITTLLTNLVYLVVFLATLYFIRKFITSDPKYIFLLSLIISIILGVISSESLYKIISSVSL